MDVYSDWSGPCTGMVSILKKIKMEIGGDALSYATVIVRKHYIKQDCCKYCKNKFKKYYLAQNQR